MTASPSPRITSDPTQKLTFIDNKHIAEKPQSYQTLIVDLDKIVESWRKSLFSYEWLDGKEFKQISALPEKDQKRRLDIEDKIQNNHPVEKPVLGMGILDNVEIGMGRAALLTLFLAGAKKMPVHVPNSQLDFFKDFQA